MPVVLLCHCDGINGSTVFTDGSSYEHTLTAAGTATVGTANPKFGSGCANFTSGTAPRISSNTPADFNLGAGQFTVEAWVYFTAGLASPAVQVVAGQWHSSLGNLGWVLAFNGPSTMLFRYSTTGSDGVNAATASFTPTLNQWYHIAADRDASNTVRLYINGAVVGSGAAAATIFASTLPFMIGNDNSTADFPSAFIDEVRITTGLAQYGGAFTPPTVPFDGINSGVKEMSFVAGRNLVLGAGVATLLPTMVDVGGNGNSYSLYSHIRLPGGTTYTFDTGVVWVIPATTDSVLAMPPGALTITATAASTAQLGQSI